MKSRIDMLYKDKSSNWVLGKYLAVMLLVGFVAVSMAFKPATIPEIAAQTTPTIKVKGAVVNTDNKPLSNFLVKVTNARMVFLTDNLGQYEAIIPSGSELVFNSKDYKSVDVRVKDDRVVNAILARLESTDSSVVLVYPFLAVQKGHPNQPGLGKLIPRFYDDQPRYTPDTLEFKLRFLGTATKASAVSAIRANGVMPIVTKSAPKNR